MKTHQCLYYTFQVDSWSFLLVFLPLLLLLCFFLLWLVLIAMMREIISISLYKGFRLMILIKLIPYFFGANTSFKAYFNYTLSIGFFCAIGCFADCSDSNYFCVIASFLFDGYLFYSCFLCSKEHENTGQYLLCFIDNDLADVLMSYTSQWLRAICQFQYFQIST